MAAQLQERTWILTGINAERIPSEKLKGRAPSVSFNLSDSTLTGFGGCNKFHGHFEHAKKEISIGPLRSNKMACADNKLEDDFFKHFQGNFKCKIRKSNLYLMRNGKIVLSFRPSTKEEFQK